MSRGGESFAELLERLRERSPIDVKLKPLNLADVEALDEQISDVMNQLVGRPGTETFDLAWANEDVQRLELLRAKIVRLLSLTPWHDKYDNPQSNR